MEKLTPTRHWKNTHKRNDSADSFNDSIHSNRSSLSSGYNKFQFKRHEEAQKKNAVFHFSSRNRENPHDVSVLTKRSNEVQEPKQARDDQSILRKIPSLNHGQRMPSFTQDRARFKAHIQGTAAESQLLESQPLESQPPMSQPVVREIKFLIRTLRNTIEYFNRQMRELKLDWDLAMKTLIRKQVEMESTTIGELRGRLEENQKEIDRLSRESSFVEKNVFASGIGFKAEQGNRVEVPLTGLAGLAGLTLSGVGMGRLNDNEGSLSRHNTLNSLLAADFSPRRTPKSQYGSKQLALLRQTMRRMSDLLQPPV